MNRYSFCVLEVLIGADKLSFCALGLLFCADTPVFCVDILVKQKDEEIYPSPNPIFASHSCSSSVH